MRRLPPPSRPTTPPTPSDRSSPARAAFVRRCARHRRRLERRHRQSAPVTAGAEVHVFPENRGKGAALRAAFSILFAARLRRVVTIDADGQHLPEETPRLLAVAGDADLVLGTRDHLFAEMGNVRRLSNRLSSRAISWAAGQAISDVQTGFRLYTRALIERTGFPESGFEAESAVVVRAVRLGLRVTTTPVRSGACRRPEHESLPAGAGQPAHRGRRAARASTRRRDERLPDVVPLRARRLSTRRSSVSHTACWGASTSPACSGIGSRTGASRACRRGPSGSAYRFPPSSSSWCLVAFAAALAANLEPVLGPAGRLERWRDRSGRYGRSRGVSPSATGVLPIPNASAAHSKAKSIGAR